MEFTPQQFAAQGGTINKPTSSGVSAYQSFVKNNVPNAVQPPQDGLVAGIAKDVLTTLAVKPATRIAQAGVAPLQLNASQTTTNIQNQQTDQLNKVIGLLNTETDPVKKQALHDMALNLVKQAIPNTEAGQQANSQGSALQGNTHILGQDIQGQEGGAAGVKQIAGDALKSASYLIAPEAVGATGEATSAGSKILTGAATGAGIGAASGAGSELQNPNSTFGSVAKSTGEGLLTGAAIGGAIPAIGEGVKGTQNAMEDFANKPDINPKIEAPKISPEQQEIQNNITQSQQELEQAKSKSDFAAEQRKNVTPQAIEGVKGINEKVSGNIKTLGTEFGKGAADLEQSNPNLKLNLTNEQIEALNALKENKNFSLPEKIQQTQDVNNKLQNGYEGVKLTGKALEEYNAGQKATQVSLSPTETQDLIKELNRSTFRQNADGSVTKDYQRLGVTNEIKKAASEAFGGEWDTLYSKYAQGRGMIDKLDSITNLDPKATPEDLNKQLEGILKQSKTPEGKMLLQQAIDEYKQSSGIDLNDPIKSIQQIADKQTALDEADSNLSDAQKAANKAQREADIAKIKQEQKMSTFKGRHPVLTSNANMVMRRTVGGAISIGILYPAIRAILKAAQGK